MDPREIRQKFGGDYCATEHTFRLGIDIRLTRRVAQRFRGRTVLETCTGAGFSTIALAEVATHVVTIEIDPDHQAEARANIRKAGLEDRVTFVLGDALSEPWPEAARAIDAAFLDPDWAITGPDHVFRLRGSNMRPPADLLLDKMLARTQNVALILPPSSDLLETAHLPPHELQSLYLDGSHALYCLCFGALANERGPTVLRA